MVDVLEVGVFGEEAGEEGVVGVFFGGEEEDGGRAGRGWWAVVSEGRVVRDRVTRWLGDW